MSGYKIIDRLLIDKHISFFRIEPTSVELTLKEVFNSLSNLSWIHDFDKKYIQESYQLRAAATVKHIADNIIKSTDTSITSDSGEYVISELARKTLVNELKYLDIPLAELFKEATIGNPGFDFYSKNLDKILLFGEAKYNASQNSYGKAFEQIVRFEKEKQDLADIIDIDKFCCEDSKENFSCGKKGYVAAFASKKIKTDQLVKNIKKNKDYLIIEKFNELICVAVNI